MESTGIIRGVTDLQEKEMKYKVTMICREIWRAETVVATEGKDLEAIKDAAWSRFNGIKSRSLEQENFTKVEALPGE